MTKKPAAKGGAKDLTNKKSSTGSNFPLTKKAKWGGTENGAKEQKGKDFKNGAKKDFKKGAKNTKFQKKGRLLNNFLQYFYHLHAERKQWNLEVFHFRWLNIREIGGAFAISITLISNHLK